MFCTQCGSEVEEGCEFCTECGARVHEIVAGPYSEGSESQQSHGDESTEHTADDARDERVAEPTSNTAQDDGADGSDADEMNDEGETGLASGETQGDGAASPSEDEGQDDEVADPAPAERPGPAEASDEAAPGEEGAVAVVVKEKRDDGARLKRYALIAIGSAAIAVICVCVGVFLAGGFSKGRSYAITLPVSAPRLTDAGSRIPVKAQRMGSGPSDVVNTYVSCTGIGLELSPGTWEVAVEGSPIAEDGTLYDFSDAMISVEVKEDKSNDSCTAEPSKDLVITPKEMVSIPDSEIEDAVKWAKNDTGRTSGSSGEVAQQMSSEEVNELASKLESAVKSKRGLEGYDLLLAKLRAVEWSGWSFDAGLSEVPLGGPSKATKDGKSKEAFKSKLAYALHDLDGDGADELLVYPKEYSEAPERCSSGYMMLYTLVDGRPKLIDKGPCFYDDASVEYHDVTDDGRVAFVKQGHQDGTYTFLSLKGSELDEQVKYNYMAGDGAFRGELRTGEPISDEEFEKGIKYKPVSLDKKPLIDFSPDLEGAEGRAEGEAASSRSEVVNQCFEAVFPSSGIADFYASGIEGFLDQSLAGNSHVGSPGSGFGSKAYYTGNPLTASLLGISGGTANVEIYGMLDSYDVSVKPVSSELFVAEVVGSMSSSASAGVFWRFAVSVDEGTNKIDEIAFLSDGDDLKDKSGATSISGQSVLGYDLNSSEDYRLLNTFLSNFTEVPVRRFGSGTDGPSTLSMNDLAAFATFHCGINSPDGVESPDGNYYDDVSYMGRSALGGYNARVSIDYVSQKVERFFGLTFDPDALSGDRAEGFKYEDGYVYFLTTAPFAPMGVGVAKSLTAVDDDEMDIEFSAYLTADPYDATDGSLYGLPADEIAAKIGAREPSNTRTARVRKVAGRDRAHELVLVGLDY